MYECFCGNDGLGKNGGIAPELTCNTPCQGDPTQTCGGGHRLSVYELSPLKKSKCSRNKPIRSEYDGHEPMKYKFNRNT